MSATDIVEGLVKAGTAMKDAFSKAKQRDSTMDWAKFVGSPECDAAYGQVSTILQGLTQDSVDKALVEVRGKEAALLGGKSVVELPTDKLAQYDALLDVENQLMRKYAASAGRTEEWLSWVVNDALPILIKVAKVVIPLLL